MVCRCGCRGSIAACMDRPMVEQTVGRRSEMETFEGGRGTFRIIEGKDRFRIVPSGSFDVCEEFLREQHGQLFHFFLIDKFGLTIQDSQICLFIYLLHLR